MKCDAREGTDGWRGIIREGRNGKRPSASVCGVGPSAGERGEKENDKAFPSERRQMWTMGRSGDPPPAETGSGSPPTLMPWLKRKKKGHNRFV